MFKLKIINTITEGKKKIKKDMEITNKILEIIIKNM